MSNELVHFDTFKSKYGEVSYYWMKVFGTCQLIQIAKIAMRPDTKLAKVFMAHLRRKFGRVHGKSMLTCNGIPSNEAGTYVTEWFAETMKWDRSPPSLSTWSDAPFVVYTKPINLVDKD